MMNRPLPSGRSIRKALGVSGFSPGTGFIPHGPGSLSGSTATLAHGHGDVHAEKGGSGTGISAPQRQNLLLIPRHGNTNQIAVSDDTVRRIEIDPAGARQVRLHPGMG